MLLYEWIKLKMVGLALLKTILIINITLFISILFSLCPVERKLRLVALVLKWHSERPGRLPSLVDWWLFEGTGGWARIIAFRFWLAWWYGRGSWNIILWCQDDFRSKLGSKLMFLNSAIGPWWYKWEVEFGLHVYWT